MAYAAFKIIQVTWTQENPKAYRSSPRAKRLFCGWVDVLANQLAIILHIAW